MSLSLPCKGRVRREAPGVGPTLLQLPPRLVSLATLPRKRGRDKKHQNP
jgi:hypothetical protein